MFDWWLEKNLLLLQEKNSTGHMWDLNPGPSMGKRAKPLRHLDLDQDTTPNIRTTDFDQLIILYLL